MPQELRPSVPGAIIGYRNDGRPIRLIAGGDESNDLAGQLDTRRGTLITANREILSAATAANRATTADEDTRYAANMTEIRALNQRLDDLGDQAAREERARAARAGDAGGVADDHGTGARASGAQVTSEPMIYGEHSPNSYWADLARDAFANGDGGGGLDKSRERLGRHAAELRVELPRRQERRARAAQERVERLHAASRREERAFEQFIGTGAKVFEQRALNRTDGTGGYFVPPLWLVDQYVAYLRAGRVLANLCQSVPLPMGTDSINLPRITTGTGTGVQTSDGGGVPSRDMADNFVNALVRTVAGQEDVGIQLLDQSPIAFDTVITKDLMQDHAMQVDGLVLLGSGSSGQITGLYPQGTITGGSTPGIIVNGVTGTTTSQWVGDSGRADFYSGVGQLFSQIGRNRFQRARSVVSNEAVWNSFATSTDANKRPLVPPGNQGPFNAAATGDFDPGAPDEGPVGTILGRTWYVDNNIPLTFGGGTTNPSMASVSAGHTSPTDGSGSGDNFTPVIAGVFDDLLLFEGEIRTRVLQEILSGTLQVRFQIYSYLAFMANRYQDANSRIISYGNANSGTTAGAALSTGTGGGLVGLLMAGIVTDLAEWLLDGKPSQPYRSNFSRRATLLAGGFTAVAAEGYVVPVVCQQGDIITSVTVGVKTATSSTPTHGWAALYTGVTTADTLIAQSPDDTSGFHGSGAAQTFTLSAPHTVGTDPGTTGPSGPLVFGVMLYNDGGAGGVLDALGQGSEAVAGGVYITGQVPLLFSHATLSAGATAPATLTGFAAATAGTNMAATPLVILH